MSGPFARAVASIERVDVDADDLDAAPRELDRDPTGPAARVERRSRDRVAHHERRLTVHVDAATRRARRTVVGSRRPAMRVTGRVSRTGAGPRILGPMPRLRVAAAQLNVVVGDLEGNARADPRGVRRSRGGRLRPRRVPRADRHRVPARRPALAARVRRAGRRDARQDRRRAPRGRRRSIGFPEPGRDLHNAAAVCANGRVYGVYRKQLLPNYAVFDEQRYFVAPREPLPLFDIARREGRRSRSARTRGARRVRSWPRRPAARS